jgi:hypothetical protein
LRSTLIFLSRKAEVTFDGTSGLFTVPEVLLNLSVMMKTSRSVFIARCFLWGTSCLVASHLVSCQTARKYVAGGAAVTASATLDDVRDNVIDVMREEAYTTASGYGDELVFERHGQFKDRMLYGGLYRPERTFTRATVTLREVAENKVQLRGTATVIRDEGGMQDEETGWLLGDGRYRLQSLLSEAASRAERDFQAHGERNSKLGLPAR